MPRSTQLAVSLALALVACLTGCGQHPQRGTVVALRHVPAHTTVSYVPVSGGRSPSLVPVNYEVPEAWLVTVKVTASGQEQVLSVTAQEYRRLKVGDPYTVP